MGRTTIGQRLALGLSSFVLVVIIGALPILWSVEQAAGHG